jgi:hypothetical protein
MQQAGLIGADLPVPIVTYLMTVLKTGFIYAPDVLGQTNVPPLKEVTEALSIVAADAVLLLVATWRFMQKDIAR